MIRRTRDPRSVVELQGAADGALATYCDPLKLYAYRTYDHSPKHTGQLLPADVLMANLLSLRLGWRDVIPLFAGGNTPFTDLRRALDTALDESRALGQLEDLDDPLAQMPALTAANALAAALPVAPGRTRRSWGPVTVSKVLHRLAPAVPVIDSVVRGFYNADAEGVRLRLWRDLQTNREWLTPLGDRYDLPLSRVVDVIIWVDGRTA